MNVILRNIPNTITLANLFFGFLSIIFAFEQKIDIASICIIIGAMSDFFDGLTARALKIQSDFGKQLDSLSDMITFGLAPSIILFQLLCTLQENNQVKNEIDSINLTPIILASAIPICSAIRLAKFNLESNEKKFFIGLPTPASAIFIAGLALSIESTAIFSNFYFLLTSSILLPFFMISNVRIISFKIEKKEKLLSTQNILRIILFFTSIVLLLNFQFTSLPFIVILLIIFSIINNNIK